MCTPIGSRGCQSKNALQNSLPKSRKMLFIFRIQSKLHSIIAKTMNIINLNIFALDILIIYWMTYYSNRSIKLFRCTFTQLQIKILAKKLEVKPLHYC